MKDRCQHKRSLSRQQHEVPQWSLLVIATELGWALASHQNHLPHQFVSSEVHRDVQTCVFLAKPKTKLDQLPADCRLGRVVCPFGMDGQA